MSIAPNNRRIPLDGTSVQR